MFIFVLLGVAVNYNITVMFNKAINYLHDNLVKSFLHTPITLLDQQILSEWNKIWALQINTEVVYKA